MKKFDFNTLKINNVYYENNPTYFQFLVELINKSGSGFSRAILSTGELYAKLKTLHLSRHVSVKEKAKQSLFDSYGIINPGQLKCNRDILLIKSYNNFILTNEFDEPMFTLEEYLNRKDNTELLKFKCKKCGHIFLAKHVAGHHKHCEKCYPQCRIPIAEKKFG